MAANDDARREARTRYVIDRQSLPVIALALGVSSSTASRWKRDAKRNGDDWDVARAASTVQCEGLDSLIARLVEDYVIQHQATIDDLKSRTDMQPLERAQVLASLADSMSKTTASAGRLSPKINKLGVAMDVLRLLGEFLPEQFPQHTEALLEVLEPFGGRLAEVYK